MHSLCACLVRDVLAPLAVQKRGQVLTWGFSPVCRTGPCCSCAAGTAAGSEAAGGGMAAEGGEVGGGAG